jgi:hypothetical protein
VIFKLSCDSRSWRFAGETGRDARPTKKSTGTEAGATENGSVPASLPGENGSVPASLPGENGSVPASLPGESGSVPASLPGVFEEDTGRMPVLLKNTGTEAGAAKAGKVATKAIPYL